MASSRLEMRNKHEGVENLIYLIDAGGVRIMHVGDALLRDNREYLGGLEYGPSGVDLLFLGPWGWPAEVALAQEWMSPEKIIFMHLAPDVAFRSPVFERGKPSSAYSGPLKTA